ncbi:hypothetical protein [Aquisphaera insulae]|uniref:hypothetical protein n=1 Tax=Aquisphaera insulae TaxID=2712864 RepID=UPI0013EA6F9E|nr:hypothetical protein [Aquisphaera insulae]
MQYAAIVDLLPSGNYLLGILSVDLTKAGLSWPLVQALAVSIEGVDSRAGAQDPDDYSTFT